MAKHLIISDLHESISALQAAIKEGEKLGGFTDIWSLGDVVGRHSANSADANDCIACLDLLRQWKLVAIRGNWEQWLLRNRREKKRSKYYKLLSSRYRELQSASMLIFIKGWPGEEIMGDFTLSHGSPFACNNNGQELISWETYLHPWMADCVSAMFSQNHILTKHMLFGHTHSPGYFHYNGKFTDWIPVGIDQYRKPITLGNHRQNHFAINPGSLVRETDRDSGTALLLDDVKNQLMFFDIHK